MQILCVLPFSLVIQYLLWSLLITFLFGCFQATPNGSQGLLLAQYQGSLGGMLWGARDWTKLAACKASCCTACYTISLASFLGAFTKYTGLTIMVLSCLVQMPISLPQFLICQLRLMLYELPTSCGSNHSYFLMVFLPPRSRKSLRCMDLLKVLFGRYANGDK